MRKIVCGLTVAAFGLVGVGTAGAVPNHQHLLTTGSGDKVRVGPNVCENPQTATGWLNFHKNVHVGVPGTEAFDSASNPVDIAATGCNA